MLIRSPYRFVRVSVERTDEQRHRQLRGARLDVQQQLAVKIRHRLVFGGMDHPQDIFAAIIGAQVEVAIALANQRLDCHVETKVDARQLFGFVVGHRWRRDLKQLSKLLERRSATGLHRPKPTSLSGL